jgi:hypothetical protein
MKRVLVVAAAALSTAAAISPLLAYPPGRRPGPPPPPSSAFQFRLGYFMPHGDSNFWSETEQVFTLDADDFDDFSFGFSYVWQVRNGVELGVNFDLFEDTVLSEVRGFVDEDGFPILHDTELAVFPLTFDVRFVPGGRHRMRPGGYHAPKTVFYFGAGAGFTFWEYHEYGDFVDFSSPPFAVIYGDFYDEGEAFEVHGLAGAEIPLSRMTNLLFEGRYSLSEDDLGGGFGDLQNRELDLGGLGLYAGFAFRF